MIEMTALAPNRYCQAELTIGRWQLCYNPQLGFGFSHAGVLALGERTIRVWEPTLCVASATDHYLSGGKSVAPDGLGIIDIDKCDEGVLIVGPGDPVTIFNLHKAGHRPTVIMEGMIDDREWYRITDMRLYISRP